MLRIPSASSNLGVALGAAAAAATSTICFARCAHDGTSPGHGRSAASHKIKALTDRLQIKFVRRLQRLENTKPTQFKAISWLRDGGLHGGGMRYEAEQVPNGADDGTFNQATINVSAVHYEDKPNFPIDSATALSIILHPRSPHAPSLHLHISYMEPRTASPYWRMIADLNPSIPCDADKERFASALAPAAVGGAAGGGGVRRLTPELRADAVAFGDRYFFIPAVQRHRGIFHFFVATLDEEELRLADICNSSSHGGDTDCDRSLGSEFAESLADTVLEAYASIVEGALGAHPTSSSSTLDLRQQLDFYSLYVFQVLTLDRGTTHGLLAHDENDVGTLGSLPPRIDRDLLRSWGETKVLRESSARELLQRILAVIPEDGVIDDCVKVQLARELRDHYRQWPGAQAEQADMDLKWWAELTKERKRAFAERQAKT